GHLGVDVDAARTAGEPAARKAASARKAPTGKAAVRRPGEAVLIEVLLLGGVVQDAIGFLHFLVGGVGLLIAWVPIGVMLFRQLAVSLLNLVRACGFRDAENFVGIAGHG